MGEEPCDELADDLRLTPIRKMQHIDGYDDLEMALEAAERMLAEADARHRYQESRTFTIWSLVVVVVASLLASLLAFSYLYSIIYCVVPVVVAIVLLSLLFRLLRVQQHRARYDLRLRLAGRLASLINESYLEVAERERWSYLRREATKIRLNAFPLESAHKNSDRTLKA